MAARQQLGRQRQLEEAGGRHVESLHQDPYSFPFSPAQNLSNFICKHLCKLSFLGLGNSSQLGRNMLSFQEEGRVCSVSKQSQFHHFRVNGHKQETLAKPFLLCGSLNTEHYYWTAYGLFVWPKLELPSHFWPTQRKNRGFIMMPQILRILGTSRKLGEHHNSGKAGLWESPVFS